MDSDAMKNNNILNHFKTTMERLKEECENKDDIGNYLFKYPSEELLHYVVDFLVMNQEILNDHCCEMNIRILPSSFGDGVEFTHLESGLMITFLEAPLFSYGEDAGRDVFFDCNICKTTYSFKKADYDSSKEYSFLLDHLQHASRSGNFFSNAGSFFRELFSRSKT